MEEFHAKVGPITKSRGESIENSLDCLYAIHSHSIAQNREIDACAPHMTVGCTWPLVVFEEYVSVDHVFMSFLYAV